MVATQRILVVDDEPEVRDLIREALQSESLVVVECADGQQAIEQLARESFDLLVTDLRMPKLSGTQLIARCRTESKNPDVQIVAISGAMDATTRRRLSELGIAESMGKPFSLDELRASALRLLTRQTPQPKTAERGIFDAFLTAATTVLASRTNRNFQYGEFRFKCTSFSTGIMTVLAPFELDGSLGTLGLVLTESLLRLLHHDQQAPDLCEDLGVVLAEAVGQIHVRILQETESRLGSESHQFRAGLPSVILAANQIVFQNSRMPILSAPLLTEGGVQGSLTLMLTPCPR